MEKESAQSIKMVVSLFLRVYRVDFIKWLAYWTGKGIILLE